MSSATPVLSLDKVSKVYPGSKALSGVSLDIHAGEVLGLIGQNGAGKSTIVKILSGAIQPTEGRILIEGRPVSFAGPASAQRVTDLAVVTYGSDCSSSGGRVFQRLCCHRYCSGA